jgi:hypothetical protein
MWTKINKFQQTMMDVLLTTHIIILSIYAYEYQISIYS